MSKYWNPENASSAKGMLSLLKFNLGRIASFSIFGGLLGITGSMLSLSLEFMALLIIITSLIMTNLGLQMTGIFPALNKLNLRLPKGRRLSEILNAGTNPTFLGAATFLIPCSFTLIAQMQALGSGSAIEGAVILTSFVLGTTPMLLLIGFTSRHFTLSKKTSQLFLKTAGMVVIFFAIYTLGNQLNLLGIIPSQFSNINANSGTIETAIVKDGVQRAKLTALDMGYLENKIVLQKGVPAELTIMGQTFGCASSVVARDFWDGVKFVRQGEIDTIKFTPGNVGSYKGSCSMGMYSFEIQVI